MAAAAAATIAKQPDISYHPDYEKYKLRSERIKSQQSQQQQQQQLVVGCEHTSLPIGFPQNLEGDLVWEGGDWTDEREWTFVLGEDQLGEIEGAMRYFRGLDKPLGAINQTTFPLPNLHAHLRREAQHLSTGRGFLVIRGLTPEKYNIEENIIIHAGLSSHIANQRGRQDTKIVDGERQSNMVNHIKDLSNTGVAASIGAPAYTTDKQVFHTDSGDVVSLFCLNPAAEGGQSKVASAWRVYNELARSRPDIIRTLAGDWVFDGYGDKTKPYTQRPLLFHTPAIETTPERITIQYARRGFTGFLHLPRSSDIAPITEEQAEALDALHFLAEKYSLTLDFRRGDVQYINNLGVFHARDGFRDGAGQERHLLRLWLRDEEQAWETPLALSEKWDALYKDVSVEEQVFSLTPQIRGGAGRVSKVGEGGS